MGSETGSLPGKPVDLAGLVTSQVNIQCTFLDAQGKLELHSISGLYCYTIEVYRSIYFYGYTQVIITLNLIFHYCTQKL